MLHSRFLLLAVAIIFVSSAPKEADCALVTRDASFHAGSDALTVHDRRMMDYVKRIGIPATTTPSPGKVTPGATTPTTNSTSKSSGSSNSESESPSEMIKDVTKDLGKLQKLYPNSNIKAVMTAWKAFTKTVPSSASTTGSGLAAGSGVNATGGGAAGGAGGGSQGGAAKKGGAGAGTGLGAGAGAGGGAVGGGTGTPTPGAGSGP